LALYENIYRLLDAQMPKPDLVVFMFAQVEKLLERLRRRNRDFERNISREYLERVSAAFRDFFFYYEEAPLLVVDTTAIDFIEDSDDLRDLLREIEQTGAGVQHFVPRKS
jgi:deoxyadenosine/deoxycytidine kinase